MPCKHILLSNLMIKTLCMLTFCDFLPASQISSLISSLLGMPLSFLLVSLPLSLIYALSTGSNNGSAGLSHLASLCTLLSCLCLSVCAQSWSWCRARTCPRWRSRWRQVKRSERGTDRPQVRGELLFISLLCALYSRQAGFLRQKFAFYVQYDVI